MRSRAGDRLRSTRGVVHRRGGRGGLRQSDAVAQRGRSVVRARTVDHSLYRKGGGKRGCARGRFQLRDERIYRFHVRDGDLEDLDARRAPRALVRLLRDPARTGLFAGDLRGLLRAAAVSADEEL